MTWEFLAPLLAVALFFAVAFAWRRLARARDHLAYLQQEVVELGGEDRWDETCTHCGDPMRDATSVRLSTRFAVDGGWTERTHGVFHTDRPECAAAVVKAEAEAEVESR